MTVLDAAAAERGKLRRVLGRMDTVFFLISAMVVVDTIGAIAVGGGETFTWLVVLFVTFFIPSAWPAPNWGRRSRKRAVPTCGCGGPSAAMPVR